MGKTESGFESVPMFWMVPHVRAVISLSTPAHQLRNEEGWGGEADVSAVVLVFCERSEYLKWTLPLLHLAFFLTGAYGLRTIPLSCDENDHFSIHFESNAD